MTTRRRRTLLPDAQIQRAIAAWRALGLPIGAIDIRADGITIFAPQAPHPAAPAPGNDFDRWQQEQDADRGGPSPRLKAN